MNGTPTTPPSTAPGGGARRRYRRRLAVSSAVVIAAVGLTAAGATVAGIGPLRAHGASGGPTGSGDGTSAPLATVSRQTLSERTQNDGTLGYAGSYSVVNQAAGTLTGLPAVGDVIDQGMILYWVSGSPVVLLRGSIPAYRTVSRGTSGPDVQQLNADLVALGKATSSQLNPKSDRFSAATARALKKLQDALGVDQTGVLALGQAVFQPSGTRITKVSAILGTQAPPGGVVLEASSTDRVVTIELDAAEQSVFKAGDPVTIALPDDKTTPGVVASVSKVADKAGAGESGSGGNGSGDTTPTVTVTIRPTKPADTGSTDQATVTVSIVTRHVTHALTVPVNALLALAGGGYAVEVDDNGARHLVAVTLGLFDDTAGLVQVTGNGLAAGQRVVVPAS
jgi:hypothetical protein